MILYLYAAPYYITQPSTDDDVQIVSPNADLNLRCSLNVTIPAGIMVTWLLNGDVFLTFTTTQRTNTIRTIQGTPKSGVYQCVFNDPAGYILQGNINVLGMCKVICSNKLSTYVAKCMGIG